MRNSAAALTIFVLILVMSGCSDSELASNSAAGATTQVPTATPISPSLGDNRIRPADGMVTTYVPGGTYSMGSTDTEVEEALALCREIDHYCTASFYGRESPQHTVMVDSFWIDQTEVTNAQYSQCVAAGACPALEACDVGIPTIDDESKTEHPVVCVDWHAAQTYCEWAGGRLPTEAEWEYAARGPEGLLYPWGDSFDGQRLNYCDANCTESWADQSADDGYPKTAPVGSYSEGASWCGALDMAGNVFEWTADWLGDYSAEPLTNPTGPEEGYTKVLRGNSWLYFHARFRTSARDDAPPATRFEQVGFRCVVSDADALLTTAPQASAPDQYTISPQTVDQLTLLHTIGEHNSRVNDLEFSSDGEFMVSWSDDGEIKLWQVADWQVASTISDPGFVWRLSLSPDGTLLASLNGNIWHIRDPQSNDLVDGQQIQTVDTTGRGPTVVTFSPNSTLLASADSDLEIKLWNVADWQIGHTLEGYSDRVFCIDFSPDGTLLAAGTGMGPADVSDFSVRLWDTETGQAVRILSGHRGDVHAIAFSPDGTMLASASTDGTVRLWNVQTGQLVHTLQHRDGLYDLAFSPDGALLVTAGVEYVVRIWDVESGRVLHTLPHNEEMMAVAFSPDGAFLASAGYDHNIYVWGVPQ